MLLARFEPILVKYVLNIFHISNMLVISVLFSLIIMGDNSFILFLDKISFIFSLYVFLMSCLNLMKVVST